MANEAAAKHGITNKSETNVSNTFFQRAFNFGFRNNDMIRTSSMSASAMPTVVVTERRRKAGVSLASLTRERAYVSLSSTLSATSSSQQSSRVCLIRRRKTAVAG